MTFPRLLISFAVKQPHPKIVSTLFKVKNLEMGHPQDREQSKIKDLVKPDIHAELSESSRVSYKNAKRGSIC